MLLGVKVAIIKSGKHGYEIARALNWHQSKLSAIINETYQPSSMEKEDLAIELGTTVGELFPEQASAEIMK